MAIRSELELRAAAVGIDPSTIHNDSVLEQRVSYNEQNAQAATGTLASGTLTASGNAANTDTMTIGSQTYTIVTGLTEAKASATLTAAGNAVDGETLSVGARVYVFKDTLSNPVISNEIKIGVSAAVTLDNVKDAINDSGTPGTEYSVGTLVHEEVEATTNTDTTQLFVALRVGTYANKIESGTDGADLSFAAGKFAGGVNPVKNQIVRGGSAAVTLDNIKDAVNAEEASRGVTFSTSTHAHPQVTATTNTDTTQLFVARDKRWGNLIGTTETLTTMSFGAATLASGVPAVVTPPAKSVASVAPGQNV